MSDAPRRHRHEHGHGHEHEHGHGHGHGHGPWRHRRAWRERERAAWREERALWQASPERSRWWPWWLRARMRRRIFSWLGVALAIGLVLGTQLGHDGLRWWHVLLLFLGLWAAAGAVAWRLTRPLLLAVKAARDLGDGKLDTRLDVDHHHGEVRVLAHAINDMAAAFQRQLADQRQLLAAVSHELRTPLGHMRVLVESAREAEPAAGARALDQLERDILVVDDLVARLLASSRLEFASLDRRRLDVAAEVADAALADGVAPEQVSSDGDTTAQVDPTLLRRAVANLLGNARIHAGGAVAVRVERRGEVVAVEVDDAGPGLPPDRRADGFRAFVPSSAGGLGLGLALVARIAAAHGGRAWAEDRPGGGARVGFSVAVVSPTGPDLEKP
ncbi:MAG: HAMP domain-containing protein [Kofleriaceae bacterium]|nr:HAMP domain-containing protein [Kofleriaceae bacterium]